MIVLLSPAKTLDVSAPPPEILSSTPRGKQEADKLATQLSTLSETQLKDLLKVSSNIARSVAMPFQQSSTQMLTKEYA